MTSYDKTKINRFYVLHQNLYKISLTLATWTFLITLNCKGNAREFKTITIMFTITVLIHKSCFRYVY